MSAATALAARSEDERPAGNVKATREDWLDAALARAGDRGRRARRDPSA